MALNWLQQRGLLAALLLVGFLLLGQRWWHKAYAPVPLSAIPANFLPQPFPLYADSCFAGQRPLHLLNGGHLVAIKGLGPSTAAKLKMYQACNGGWQTVEELQHLKGIGAFTFSKIAPKVSAPVWLDAWLRDPLLLPGPDWLAQQDLNALGADSLSQLCFLGKAQRADLLAVRKRLGGFRTWAEVQQAGRLHPSQHALLQLYCTLRPPDLIDLNTADATLLATLPGIGTARAAEIIALRQALGGFLAPEGILLVKGIGPKTLQKFRTRIRTSSARKPFRLALNTATERELTQHPAIGPKRAARILKLRNKQPLTPELLQQKKIWALEEWPGVAGYWVWEP